jgi:hypothetical protein
MNPARPESRAGAAALAVLLLGGITAGLYAVRGSGGPGPHEGNPRHRYAVVDQWPDGGPPADAVCVVGTYYAPSVVIGLHRMDDSSGSAEYLRCRTCGSPVDGGGPTLPVEALPHPEPVEEAYTGGPPFQCWMQETEGDGGMPCACSAGGNCEARLSDGGWGAAPRATTMQAGEWRGGCVRKVCAELWIPGQPSMPARCL